MMNAIHANDQQVNAGHEQGAQSANQPPSLYDAIANNDYKTMVQLYASAARDAVVSYSLFRRRREEPHSEEKVDEYYQHHVGDFSQVSSFLSRRRHQRHGHNRQLYTDIGPVSNALPLGGHLPPMLRGETSFQFMINDLNELLNSLKDGEIDPSTNNPGDNVKAHGSMTAVRQAESSISGARQPFKRTRKQPPAESVAAVTELQRIHSLNGRCCHECFETEMVARDAASNLSNFRPSPSFVVFSQNTRRGKGGRVCYSLSDDQSGNTNGDGDERETPIFDGSVANATPIASGTAGAGASGGTGTALHLACALDSPFALSVLLAMGADASARYTAFRRLMVHEAACSGSEECLKLLLECGRDCAKSFEYERPGVKGATAHGSSIALGGTSSGWAFRASHDVMNGATSPFGGGGTSKKVDNDLIGGGGKVDECSFVSALRCVVDLAKQVELGQMSELDAARNLLARVNLPEATRKELVKSCSFTQPTETDSASASYYDEGIGSYSVGYADGHGNTPLHWAAFKNASACVSIILSYGAHPNARAVPSGWTPLHDAAYSDAADAVQLLLDAGADVNARANSGATPLCFAAQEDSPRATKLLLDHGADPAVRCCGHHMVSNGDAVANAAQNNSIHHFHHSRFSGYTPMHYCAHYNAFHAAKVLLTHPSAVAALELPDMNERLPIHIAVSRGSSDVLRELLKGGARIDISGRDRLPSPPARSSFSYSSPPRMLPPLLLPVAIGAVAASAPLPISGALSSMGSLHEPTIEAATNSVTTDPVVVTPVSSPILRSMIPPRPITSAKPWNCLSQKSIDECQHLLSVAEMNWSPERHALFTPKDRRAVIEVLRVGKRLEQMGTGIFLDLWPLILSFCGRGWFDEQRHLYEHHIEPTGEGAKLESAALPDHDDFTQFRLEI